uniref:Uncharacterized protein n=1 Tax=Tetradesmus obliquus TaxID=3088 RepID=A0A383VM28_TETOB|eukprot:jgi/Sobl393_1/12790/SZX66231.1
MSRVSRALANLPGQPVLLNDVDEDPAAVIGAPRARVIVRWLVAVALVALLFGLVGWSYATSSELSSGIQVERTYQPTMKNIQDWERDNNMFTCPCTSMRNTVEWAAIIPQDIWQQFDDMTAPQGPVGTPKYNSFCVSHVHLGGSKPGCRLVQHAGLNIPDYGNMNLAPTPRRRGYGYQPARDDFTLRERLVQQYPGSALQAPACRAIAANLMRLNRTGLQASHLLSQLGLNITVHNAMNDTMYRTAAHVQSSIMTLWSLEVALDMVNPSWNGFYSSRGDTGDKCAVNNTCASEDCLLRWFSDHISSIAPNYTAFFESCKPDFCDVVSRKSLVTKVVGFLSTLGGLWGPLYMGAVLLWLALAKMPWLAAPGGHEAPDVGTAACK